MKLKNIFGILTAVLLASILIFTATSIVMAVGEDEEPVATEYVAPETLPPETVAPETLPPETMAPETTPPQTAPPVTQAPTEPPQTQATQVVTTQPPVTYATKKPVADTLPDADEFIKPTAVRLDDKTIAEKGDLTYGYVSWACVVIGVLVVIVVLISNKTHYSGGSGKQRYDEGNRITGQRRLLNDDYYNSRKYNAYHSKDTRR